MLQTFSSILARPEIYLLFSRLVGGIQVYRTLIRDHLRPEPGYKLLDIGCGPAHILNLLDQVDYTGFDLSPKYIEMAKKQHNGRGQFFCRKVSLDAWPHHSEFDLVLASGVVHHLSDSEAHELFDLARSVLKPGGRLVTLDGCYVEGQSTVARYLLSRDRGKFVRTQSAYEALATKVFPSVKTTIHHRLINIPYTHIILECAR